jgi:hypothetical protein
MAALDTLIVPGVVAAITAILTEGSPSLIYRRSGPGASRFRLSERPVVAPAVTITYKPSPSLSLYGAHFAFNARTFASLKAMLVFFQNVLVFLAENTNNLRGCPRAAQHHGAQNHWILQAILGFAQSREHRRTKRWWCWQLCAHRSRRDFGRNTGKNHRKKPENARWPAI